MLTDQGYVTHEVKVPQVSNPGKYTTVKVLAPPGTEWSDVIHNPDKIHTVTEYSRDGGAHFDVVRQPTSIDGKRVMIRYAEDGGIDRDGTIEIRRGVDDISLGNSSYAQVRIMVDGTHYLKGMAMYSPDKMPDGVDIIFNTNKKKGTPPEDVFKKIKDDPDNPFGALIKANGQRYYSDPNGKYVKVGESYSEATKSTKKDEPRYSLSPVNKLREEGDWSEYAKSLSSQFLSKQDLPLIKKQLNLAYDEKKTQYNEIMSLQNPALKKTLLESFADDCDASAVHLKAAALPRQAMQVILPIPSMSDKEIYAPNYKNGEKVCLVRYPHGGTFEIPELTVNNNQAKAKKALGNAKDAVGINSHVAGILSGADFDGDTVMVIPANNRGSSVRIKHDKPLEGLKDFDPKKYKYTDEQLANGAKVITSAYKQKQMGVVSNLITDMTLKGAPTNEIERAVRHSMVVIDSEKHKLDYKQSAIDNLLNINSTSGSKVFTVTNTWNGEATNYEIAFRCDYSSGSGKLRWRRLKVESGNKATDWSPAPEDQVAVGDVVNQVNSELKIDGNSIALTTGHFTISAKNLALDSAGNATFSGTVKAASIEGGTIKGATITGASGEFTEGFHVKTTDSDKTMEAIFSDQIWLNSSCGTDTSFLQIAPNYAHLYGKYGLELSSSQFVHIYADTGSSFDIHGTSANFSNMNVTVDDYVKASKFISNTKNLPVRMYAGTKVCNSGDNSCNFLSNSEINDYFGVMNASNINTVVLVANGDANAVPAHFEGTSYVNGAWYALYDRIVNGSIRINYLVVYFG